MPENVCIAVYDPAVLTVRYPEWPALSKQERYRLLQGARPSARDRVQTANVTCVELHEWLAEVINPERTVTDSITQLALGDGGTATASSDTSLNNELARLDVTDMEYHATDAESHFNTFVDSTELNGETLNELGLISDTGRFVNHAPISPDVDKTSSKTLIIEIIIGITS